MKRLLLAIPLLVFISPVNAFWGLSEEEKSICRDRASRERNEFSAKQTYNYCSKNIKAELKEKEKRRLKKLKSWKGNCDEEENYYTNKIKNYPPDVYKYQYSLFEDAQYRLNLDQCRRKLKEYNKIFGDKNK